MDRASLLAEFTAELQALGDHVPAEVDGDAHFVDDLELDSLDIVEFVANVEFILGIEVPDEDLETIPTLNLIVDYAMARMA